MNRNIVSIFSLLSCVYKTACSSEKKAEEKRDQNEEVKVDENKTDASESEASKTNTSKEPVSENSSAQPTEPKEVATVQSTTFRLRSPFEGSEKSYCQEFLIQGEVTNEVS